MRNIATIVVLLLVVAAVGRVDAQPQAPPEFETPANQRFEITPRAYMQFDWRGFPGWTVTPDTGRLEPDTLEVRRLRAGIDGRWRRWSFEASVDPMDQLDDTLIKDAYVQYRVSRALRLRGGQFKLPGGREYGTSASSLNFLERSAFAESIAARRDIGAMVSGEIGRALEYEAGVFTGDGKGRQERSGITTAGSATWTVVRRLDVTGSFSVGRTSAVDSDPSNGFEGRTSTGYRFFEGLYVDGLRTRFGANASWRQGPWRVTAEVLRVAEARDGQGLDLEDLPTLIGFGWSSAVTREFGRRPGGNRSRLHEWDLAVRFDALAFDDDGPETVSDSVRPRATDVRARGARTLTTGVSWNFSRWARVLAEAAADHYTDARSAPVAGKSGVYLSFGTRLQIELP